MEDILIRDDWVLTPNDFILCFLCLYRYTTKEKRICQHCLDTKEFDRQLKRQKQPPNSDGKPYRVVGYSNRDNDSNTKKYSLRRSFTELNIKQIESYHCEYIEYNAEDDMVYFICKCGYKDSKKTKALLSTPKCSNCVKLAQIEKNQIFRRPDQERMKAERKFTRNCGRTLKKFLTSGSKNIHSELKYSPQDLQNHIKSHPNYEKAKAGILSIDHIFPISAFIKHNIFDKAIISHLSNLQPITKSENSKKSNKYNKEEFYKWLGSIGYDMSGLSERIGYE